MDEDKKSVSRLIKKNKNYYKTRTRAAIAALEDQELSKRKENKSEDTVIRLEIHQTIVSMLNEKKGKIEILTYLNNKYPNISISKYFERYIEDHMRKIGIFNDAQEIDERE